MIKLLKVFVTKLTLICKFSTSIFINVEKLMDIKAA